MPSKKEDLAGAAAGALNPGTGRRGTVRGTAAHPPTDLPVHANTGIPGDRDTSRVTASYKISPRTREEMRRFAKWINRDKEPNDETEIGQMVDDALVAYMRANGWEM